MGKLQLQTKSFPLTPADIQDGIIVHFDGDANIVLCITESIPTLTTSNLALQRLKYKRVPLPSNSDVGRNERW
jgi:hypothetical protein